MKEFIKVNIFHNVRKVTIDNIVFSSQAEGRRYNELKLSQSLGEICKLELQKKFLLQEKFEYEGKKYREINYICDFFYYNKKLKAWIVEDVKGLVTKVYLLKKKMFLKKYGKLYKFKEIK